jgi:hypothetical protein
LILTSLNWIGWLRKPHRQGVATNIVVMNGQASGDECAKECSYECFRFPIFILVTESFFEHYFLKRILLSWVVFQIVVYYFRMATEEEKASKCPKDLHRYRCKTCGITRSKCILVKLHIISSHGRESLKDEKIFSLEAEGQSHRRIPCVCQECGVSFNKPSHLKQQKLSHTGQVGYITNHSIYANL